MFAVLMFLFGLSVLSYPHIEGAQLVKASDEAVEVFLNTFHDETHFSTPPDVARPYAELYEAMVLYNEAIRAEHQEGLSDPWAYEETSFDLAAYGIEDGVFAVLSIPKMELEMPVYLGASYDNMAKGAAHLSQTSLPIGGDNTNCVIAGHRGWSGAPYFLYINKLQIGDEVSLTNLWETMTYTVIEIRIIEPNAVDQILIQDGRELMTLMSCDPPASGGRFRYLVYCERIKESAL